MEVRDNEIIYFCNFCDEGFYETDMLKKAFYESPPEGLQSLDQILTEHEDKCD